MALHGKMTEIKDTQEPENIVEPEPAEVASQEPAVPESEPAPKKVKHKFSGAYWYVPKDNEQLIKQSVNRTLLHLLAIILALVVQILPPPAIYTHLTEKVSSYAYFYIFAVLITIGVAIYVIINDFTRYKLMKRIPVERAPKKGFRRTTYFGMEVLDVMFFILFVIQLSFICMVFEGTGLVAMFLYLLSTAASVWAREITIFTLRDAEYVPAAEE